MPQQLYQWLPPEGVKIILVLFLSFLIGLEREEHKASTDHYGFGGVRTFPLIGLLGYSLALLSGAQLIPVAVGFAVVAAFLWLSYRHKLATAEAAGVTSEMSGLATYVVGALVYHELFWIATTLSVASMLLLELKVGLESLTKRIAPEEILTFTKFLLLSAVILPVLPNQEFGPFLINPFKTWLVVVAVSAVSYGSYVLQGATKETGGVVLAAVLGGAYSSTATTVVLARRAQREKRPHLFAGCTLIASGMMYLRLIALVSLFSRSVLALVGVPFAALAALAGIAGWIWSRLPDGSSGEVKREYQPGNPLELRAAFMFALLFLFMLVATRLASAYLGKGGVYALGAIMGLADVDPFIMGMTQSAGVATQLPVAASGILIAAASNNVAKGIYAYTLSDRRTGVQSLCLLVALAILGLAPLLWLGP
ncbi:MAG TPA: MgtC/SapB family protein [Bryobacteraceae bacterium]|nr:MgtC/SapB family protein [Bryobacteraceae bacterium]